MPGRTKHAVHPLGRELSIKPRRTGYVHREVVAVHDGWGVTEGGEIFKNLPIFAATYDPCVWVTMEPESLLTVMVDRFKDHPAFNYQIIESAEVEVEGPHIVQSARLTRFGFNSKKARASGLRNKAMHTVWSPGDMSRNPGDYLDSFDHAGLLKFGCDVRNWCGENDIPLPSALSGIAAALLRDKRFWPEARGRVPRATNENIRPMLPGVYSELRAPTGTRHRAVALDQKRAYHRAAQTVPTPDPTTLYARGYFNGVDDPTTPLWAVPGDVVYERTMSQPGLVVCQVSAAPERTHQNRVPAVKQAGHHRVALWTNEIEHTVSQGVTIHGIVAAWTSHSPDSGLPLYGAWAEQRIDEADESRRKWLKPTLHATYGLLAMRQRQVTIGHLRGKGKPGVFILGRGHEFPARCKQLPLLPSPTTNVAMLGVLQAEIRKRSLQLATALSMEGVDVLHIHADGIHVAGPLPLLDNDWSITPITNLSYLDKVSWTSDERDVLPGRDAREATEQRRHRLNLERQALEHIIEKKQATDSVAVHGEDNTHHARSG